MNNIIETYPNYLYIFDQKQLTVQDADYLVVIKDDEQIKDIPGCLICHYQDPFESYLKISLPGKMRKTNKLLSYQKSFEILKESEYGTCSFSDKEYPYLFPINHVVYQNRLFFHTGLKGYKLNGMKQKAAYNVVENLGINKEVGTHNYRSVALYGELSLVDDQDLKREVLLALVKHLAPKHPYHDKMLMTTNIIELKIDYLIGKEHIY